MDLIGRGISPKNFWPPCFLCAQGNPFVPIRCRAPAPSGVMPVGWCDSCAPRYNRVQSPPRALPVGASVTEGVGTMSKCTTPLESAVPKNAPTTLLECALTQLQDLKSFRIRTYEKVGVSPGAFSQLCEMSSWARRACAGPTTLGRSGGRRISALLVAQTLCVARRIFCGYGSAARCSFRACACQPGRACAGVTAIRRGPAHGKTRGVQVDASGDAKYNRIQSSGAT